MRETVRIHRQAHGKGLRPDVVICELCRTIESNRFIVDGETHYLSAYPATVYCEGTVRAPAPVEGWVAL